MPPTDVTTRERIRQVALEMFTERGYDGTSLREIAEQLGFTKAALYYHFKSKDAILLSLMKELKDAIEELVAWGQDRPFSADFQREMIGRLADLMYGDASHIVRLLQENQPVIRSIAAEAAQRDGHAAPEPGAWVFELLKILTPPDANLFTRTRVRTAVMAIVFGSFATQRLDADLAVDPEDQKQASLAVAQELLGATQ